MANGMDFLLPEFTPIFDCFGDCKWKILIASMEATPFLRPIHNLICTVDCMFEQRAIKLPVDPLNKPYGVFITALPNFLFQNASDFNPVLF
jgi:hypothetical protein